MTTHCRAYETEADARAAVERLLAAGVDGADVRVLMGEPARDARDAPVGRFAGTPAVLDAAIGTFAGAPATRRDGMGAFSGRADRMHGGVFAATDRETVISYPGGVERVRTAGHRGIRDLLVEAGLDASAAGAHLMALHEGRVVVLVRAGTRRSGEVARALDGFAA